MLTEDVILNVLLVNAYKLRILFYQCEIQKLVFTLLDMERA